MVGHIAVPALDKDFPDRSAALSPVMVSELLRERWGFNGVIVADEIALNEMMRMQSIEQAVVDALKAGCDAVLFLDPNPARIREAITAIEEAVESGELSRDQLSESVDRLEIWRESLGADLTPEPVQVAKLPEPAEHIEQLEPLAIEPDEIKPEHAAEATAVESEPLPDESATAATDGPAADESSPVETDTTAPDERAPAATDNACPG